MYYFAQAFQHIIALNRLQITEPPGFNGEPIQFIEWKAAFVSLIDGNAISSADKLHYLKRFVGGPMRKCLDGIFYRMMMRLIRMHETNSTKDMVSHLRYRI